MSEWSKTMRVRWGDIDPNGHMRSTSYSDMAATSRVEFLDEHGFSVARMAKLDIGPVLFEERVAFHREVHFGEDLEVTFAVSELDATGAHATVRHELRKTAGDLAAQVWVKGGWISLRERVLVTPPKELHELLVRSVRPGKFDPRIKEPVDDEPY